MSSHLEKRPPVPAPSLIAHLAGVAKNSIGLLVSRLELAALELSVFRDHVLKMVMVFSLAVIAICFSLAYGTLLIVYLTWNSMGWKILLLMTLCFAVFASALLFYARTLLCSDKLSLPATMTELKADRDMLL